MSKRIVALSAPYKFEGKDYKEIDLTPLDNLRAVDLIEAQRMLQNQSVSTTLPEFDYSYCIFLAARAAKLPVEFFLGLPAPDATRVRGMVSNFLFGAS